MGMSVLDTVSDTMPRTYQVPNEVLLPWSSLSGMKIRKALPLSPLHADTPEKEKWEDASYFIL